VAARLNERVTAKWWVTLLPSAAAFAAAVVVVVSVQRGALEGLDQRVAQGMLAIRSPVLNRVSWLFTLLGDDVFLGVAAGAVVLRTVWEGLRGRALVFAAAMVSAQGLSGLLKVTLERERPPLSEMLVAPPGSGSLPSGHAFLALVFLGGVLLLLRPLSGRRCVVRCGVAAAAGLVVVLVGMSRVLLGVHWMSDVLAGWLLGSGWVTLWAAAGNLWQASGSPYCLRRLDSSPWWSSRARKVLSAVLLCLTGASYLLSALLDPLS